MPIIDSGKVIVTGSAATFTPTITKDDAVYDLTGKTVVATIRAEDDDRTVIDSTLEDIAVTVPAGVLGATTLTLSTAMSALLPGPSRGPLHAARNYIVSYKVTTDSYSAAERLRFGVERAVD